MVESLFTWEYHLRALGASAKGKVRAEERIYSIPLCKLVSGKSFQNIDLDSVLPEASWRGARVDTEGAL